MHFVGVCTNVISFTKNSFKLTLNFVAKIGPKAWNCVLERPKIPNFPGEHAPGPPYISEGKALAWSLRDHSLHSGHGTKSFRETRPMNTLPPPGLVCSNLLQWTTCTTIAWVRDGASSDGRSVTCTWIALRTVRNGEKKNSFLLVGNTEIICRWLTDRHRMPRL